MEEFIEAELLLKRPTPFWIEMNEDGRIAYIIKVKKDPSNIMFQSFIDAFPNQSVQINTHPVIVSYRKWNIIKVINTLSSEKSRQIIIGIFGDTK